jgi:hypothetical protein
MAINNKRLSQSYSMKGEYNIQCRYITLTSDLYPDNGVIRVSLILYLFTLQSVHVGTYETVIVYKYFKKIDIKYR